MASTRAWMGTTSMASSAGRVALTVQRRGVGARSFSVIATTAPAGGTFTVYLDGRCVRTVSTASSTAPVRQTGWTSATLTPRSHAMLLVQVPGTGWVRLDGAAVALG